MGHCNQGRESASRAFDVPRGARMRLVVGLMVASACCVVAIVALPSLF